jgi:hypothetical protein
MAFDAVLNADTLDEAKEKASWAASATAVHEGYGSFEITEIKRHNALLLDALMGMVNQHFHHDTERLRHSFMSADEDAIDLLLASGS